jgi:hypothetical protein
MKEKFLILSVFISICCNPYKANKLEFADNKDSLLLVHIIQEYSKVNFWNFTDYSVMYEGSNKSVTYFVDRLFYDKDSTRLVAWIGEKMPNFQTKSKYNANEESNKICPYAKDTVFNLFVVIGYKEKSLKWKVYPWGNQQALCYSGLNEARSVLESYYFNSIKNDKIEIAENKKNGERELTFCSINYSILENKFWTNSPVWKKGSTASFNLFPFEIQSYDINNENCPKCPIPFILPIVNYPDSVR